jgi:hypothetical protein
VAYTSQNADLPTEGGAFLDTGLFFFNQISIHTNALTPIRQYSLLSKTFIFILMVLTELRSLIYRR